MATQNLQLFIKNRGMVGGHVVDELVGCGHIWDTANRKLLNSKCSATVLYFPEYDQFLRMVVKNSVLAHLKIPPPDR
jgi:hypothetical protein